MSDANTGTAVPGSAPSPPSQILASTPTLTGEQVQNLVTALEEPFDPSEIKWRVTNTSSDRRRGHVIAYADPRAYTDRLNYLFSVRGWTREYSVQTINNVERKFSNGSQIAGKVVVTCRVTIYGLGTHSGIGEEWADDDNAGTAAEAQAFKRACSCFGLGRYLYDLGENWVDLNDRKQPLSVPKLPDWALPKRRKPDHTASGNPAAKNGQSSPRNPVMVERATQLIDKVGFSLSRCVLMSVARVDSLEAVQPQALTAVVAKLEDTARGIERLRKATEVVGCQRLSQVCRDMNFPSDSLDDIPNREALRNLLDKLEREANALAQNGHSGSAGHNGNGKPPTPAQRLGEARLRLVKEAQSVARLTRQRVADVVDDAAEGAFSFNGLQRLGIEHLPAIEAVVESLKRRQ